jgi:hypothetical protein
LAELVGQPQPGADPEGAEEGISEWINGKDSDLAGGAAAMVPEALESLSEVGRRSELADLWSVRGKKTEFESAVNSIVDRLRASGVVATKRAAPASEGKTEEDDGAAAPREAKISRGEHDKDVAQSKEEGKAGGQPETFPFADDGPVAHSLSTTGSAFIDLAADFTSARAHLSDLRAQSAAAKAAKPKPKRGGRARPKKGAAVDPLTTAISTQEWVGARVTARGSGSESMARIWDRGTVLAAATAPAWACRKVGNVRVASEMQACLVRWDHGDCYWERRGGLVLIRNDGAVPGAFDESLMPPEPKASMPFSKKRQAMQDAVARARKDAAGAAKYPSSFDLPTTAFADPYEEAVFRGDAFWARLLDPELTPWTVSGGQSVDRTAGPVPLRVLARIAHPWSAFIHPVVCTDASSERHGPGQHMSKDDMVRKSTLAAAMPPRNDPTYPGTPNTSALPAWFSMGSGSYGSPAVRFWRLIRMNRPDGEPVGAVHHAATLLRRAVEVADAPGWNIPPGDGAYASDDARLQRFFGGFVVDALAFGRGSKEPLCFEGEKKATWKPTLSAAKTATLAIEMLMCEVLHAVTVQGAKSGPDLEQLWFGSGNPESTDSPLSALSGVTSVDTLWDLLGRADDLFYQCSLEPSEAPEKTMSRKPDSFRDEEKHMSAVNASPSSTPKQALWARKRIAWLHFALRDTAAGIPFCPCTEKSRDDRVGTPYVHLPQRIDGEGQVYVSAFGKDFTPQPSWRTLMAFLWQTYIGKAQPDASFYGLDTRFGGPWG